MNGAQTCALPISLAVRAELGQETIVWAIRIAWTGTYITYGLERAFGDWKIRRVSISSHIGTAARIHGDSLAHFTNRTSQIGGIHKRRAGGVELAHEDGKEMAGFRYGRFLRFVLRSEEHTSELQSLRH